MIKKNEVSLPSQRKSLTITSKIVMFCVFLALIGTVITSINSLMPARILGTTVAIMFIYGTTTILLGLIPYLIFRNKIKNPRVVIFGITFVLFTTLTLLGKWANITRGMVSNIDKAKPLWVGICVGGGGEIKYCGCLFDSLVEKYTWEKFSKMKSSPELSQSIKDLGMKCMQDDGYLFGDELKETYKKSYVESCVNTGASEATCSCYFNFLIEKLGLDGFGKMGEFLDAEPVNSPEVKKYLDVISEQKAKCGSLNE